MEDKLEQHFQTDDYTQWIWGEFHKDKMVHLPLGMHPLLSQVYNRETQGWGNLHTANVGKSNKMELGNFFTSHRANYRHVFDLGGQSEWIIDGGASENVLSCTVISTQRSTTTSGRSS